MSLSDFEGDAGHPLAAHPRLDKVAFTGSERSGVAVAAAAPGST